MKNKIIYNLQKDTINIQGRKILLNPFLYSSRLDKNTYSWLKDSGQISNTEIMRHRDRFYPEINWDNLSDQQKKLKDATIEMFLKTIDLIKTLHPDLNTDQLLQVEKKILITKKLSFEKWVQKSFDRKIRLSIKKERMINMNKSYIMWRKWFFTRETQKAILPIFVMILISFLIGWFAGVSKNSCNPYFESSLNNKL
tara:strand:- start:56 stop:646 length:591 start_codon:yes stop_codon:yes gene_type:complete